MVLIGENKNAKKPLEVEVPESEQLQRLRKEWGGPETKRRMPHQDLLDPALIWFVGNLPRVKQMAFVKLFSMAKMRQGKPAALRIMTQLETYIMTSPAVEGEQADRIVEALRQHLVQSQPLAAPQPGKRSGIFGKNESSGDQ